MRERTRFEEEVETLAGVSGRAFANYRAPGASIEREMFNEETDFSVYQESEIDAKHGKTHYLPIRLSKAVMPKIGVFLPAGFQKSAAVDIIVYFHGHIIPACQTYQSKFEKQGIEYYWNTPLFTCLREDLASSGRGAILIAPTLAPFYGNSKYPSSYLGHLDRDGKLDFLIGECLTHLKNLNELSGDARPRHIILAGHSAGGRPMQSILTVKNTLRQNIMECWGFECLYFGTTGWTTWLKNNADKKFIHYRKKNVFTGQTNALTKFKNFKDVAKDTRDLKYHCASVKEKWRVSIEDCRWLQGAAQSVKAGVQREFEKNQTPPLHSKPNMTNVFAGTFVVKDLLKGNPLSKQLIKLAFYKPKKSKTSVTIKESPSVYVPEILRAAAEIARQQKKMDAAAKLDPSQWFVNFTRGVALPGGKTGDFTFLGRKLNPEQYIHVEMAALLKKIEDKFVKELNKSPQDAGDVLLLKSYETIAGTRAKSSTAKYSYHMFGLAADINYLGNPYVETENDIAALNNALKNAASLLKSPVLTYKKDMSSDIKNRFDFIQTLDNLLERYFGLLDNQTALEQWRSNSPEWKTRSSEDAKTRIQKDLDWLSAVLERDDDAKKKYKRKDYFKKHAILNFDKTFVVGMEQTGLYWGGHYGDMMHFDMRNTGVGNFIRQAIGQYKRKVNDLAKNLYDQKKFGVYTSAGQAL